MRENNAVTQTFFNIFMYSEISDWILSKLFFIAIMLCDSWFSSIKGLGRDGLKHTFALKGPLQSGLSNRSTVLVLHCTFTSGSNSKLLEHLNNTLLTELCDI